MIKRQRAHLLLIKQVFEEIQTIGDKGAAQIKSGSCVPHTVEVSAADEKVGKRIIQTVIPLLTSASRIRRDYAGGEAPILCEVGHLRDFDLSHAVDRDTESKAPGSGIGHIHRIDQQRAVVFAETRDSYAPVWPAYDSRYQRKGIHQCSWA